MTTETEALICDCPARNMPFGRCCKLEPLTALRAEKDRLMTCLEKANISTEHFEREWYLRGDELDNLRAQLTEAQRDAERWRWLKDHARIFRQSPDMSGNHYWMVQATTTLRGPTLDAAIDAAKGETR